MSYMRGQGGGCRKTPYEKKYSRKNQMQEEWAAEKAAFDASAERVSDLEAIAEQFEARSAEGRQVALRNLARTLRHRTYDEGSLDANKRLLISDVLRSIRNRGAEALAALEALEVLALVLGSDDELVPVALDAVRALALTAAPQLLEPEQQEVVGAAVRALGVLCFFSVEDSDTATDTIRSIDALIGVRPRDAAQPVVAAALGAWELLHTLTGSDDYDDAYNARMADAIWQHLKSSKSSVDTRVAAGRALALSFSRVADDGDTARSHRGWFAATEQLEDALREGACGTAHAKSDRAKEQPLFKVLYDWMVEGKPLPSEEITIGGRRIVFESWPILARLATVRRIVQSGFLAQIKENPLMPDVLQYELPAAMKHRDAKLFKESKRSEYARDAKQRTIQRNKERDQGSDD